jgi:hypothetical protein
MCVKNGLPYSVRARSSPGTGVHRVHRVHGAAAALQLLAVLCHALHLLFSFPVPRRVALQARNKGKEADCSASSLARGRAQVTRQDYLMACFVQAPNTSSA